jgi:hypothetical protein
MLDMVEMEFFPAVYSAATVGTTIKLVLDSIVGCHGWDAT